MSLIKTGVTATLLFVAINSFAQKQRQQTNGLRISVVPSSLFDHRGTNLPIGLEYCFADRFGSKHGMGILEDAVFSRNKAVFFPAGIRIGYLIPWKKRPAEVAG